MTSRAIVAALTTAVMGFASTAAANADSAQAEELGRIAQLVAENPDEMPLRWAYAHALAAAGRYREAESELAYYESDQPQQRAEAARRRGRWLYEAGAYGDAQHALTEALGLDPASGTAHLYLGLVLARTGAPQQAALQFSLAGKLAPELASDAALLGGLTLLESGHEREGMALLRRAIEIDPQGDPARYAALVLGGRATRGAKVWLLGWRGRLEGRSV